MTRAVPISILAVFTVFKVPGQSTPAPPAFEVAEIKPSATHDTGPGKERLLPGGRIEIPHVTLRDFMLGAYGVQRNMIIGGPKWLDTDRFDIIAKSPDPNPSVPTLMTMFRTLLEERFKLVTHREDRVMPAYVLTVEKGGSKLRETTSIGGRQNCGSRPIEVDGMRLLHRECRNMTIAELARQLGLPGPGGVDRQVVNDTGLTGAYDFELDFAPQPPGRSDAGKDGGPSAPPQEGILITGPTIFEAITHLGLRLEAVRRPLSVIVIDSAGKPAEN